LSGKNIRLFEGKPLIAYAIEAARKAQVVDRVIVSTESRRVARIARRYGAEVFRRSPELSRDDTPLNWVIDDVLGTLRRDGCPVEAIVMLYPTTPLRTAADIDGAVRLARRLKTYDSVASICEASVPPFGGLLQKNGRLSYLIEGSKRLYRRQDSPRLYKLNGAIWVLNPSRFNRLNFSLLGTRSYGYEMAHERSIDIDTEFDLYIGECMARRLWRGRRNRNVSGSRKRVDPRRKS
jgi:CMP-N-acetylneuraminic acid synthetase